MPVRVVDGRATLAEGGNLAGSTLTMDEAFRRAVLEVGLSAEEAVRATSTTPARVLGLADRIGSLAPGQEADLVVMDEGMQLTAVMAAGAWVPEVGAGRADRRAF
jgi:N-acetylglucosamine-6-phosphate deacetylase